MTDHEIVTAAQVIRPYLPELVGPKAQELDGRVGDLLNRRSEDDVLADLRALLEADEATQDFVSEVIGDAPHYRPPAVRRDIAREAVFQPLAGDVQPVAHVGRYTCPLDDFTWFRPSVGAPIPICPTHGLQLQAR